MEKTILKKITALLIVLGITTNSSTNPFNVYGFENNKNVEVLTEEDQIEEENDSSEEVDAEDDSQETEEDENEDENIEENTEDEDELKDIEGDSEEDTEESEFEDELFEDSISDAVNDSVFDAVVYTDTADYLYQVFDNLQEGAEIEIVIEQDIILESGRPLTIDQKDTVIKISAEEEVYIQNSNIFEINAQTTQIVFDNVVLAGDNNGPGIFIGPWVESITIRNPQVTNFDQGIRLENLGEAEIIGGRIYDNHHAENGGGIYAGPHTELILENVKVDGNSAGDNGGGIYAEGTVTIEDGSIIENNTAGMLGGGIYAEEVMVLNKSEISGNESNEHGGGIYAEKIVIVDDSLIEKNKSMGTFYRSYGGGISGRNIEVRNNSIIRENEARTSGGGIYAANLLTVNGSVIEGNTANDNGGGIYAGDKRETTVYLNSSVIRGNRARTGGGIGVRTDTGLSDMYHGELTIKDSVIEENKSTQYGGSIFISPKGGSSSESAIRFRTSIKNSEINNNSSEKFGGGISIMNGGSDLFIEDSQLNGNFSEEGGGAVYVSISRHHAGNIFIEDTDFTDNISNGPGGAIYRDLINNNPIYINGGKFIGNHSSETGGAISPKERIYVDKSYFEANTADGAVYWDVRNPSAEWQRVYNDLITNVDSASKSPEDGFSEFNNIWNNYDIGVESEAELTGVVSFHPMGGIWAQGSEDVIEADQNLNEKINLPESISREGYALGGWFYYDYQDQMRMFDLEYQRVVALPLDLYAQWIQVELVTVIFESNGGSPVEPQVVNPYDYVRRPADPQKEGYIFAGWYQNEELTDKWNFNEDVVEDELILYAAWKTEENNNNGGGNNGGNNNGENNNDREDKDDRNNNSVFEAETVPVFASAEYPALTNEHKWYVTGYPDETFRADTHITRAEIAMIFFNLIEAEDKNTGYKAPHSDIAESVWYTDAVGYITQYGIMQGYPDGTFRPDAYITRAELATVCSMFFDMQEGVHPFTDVSDDHWAVKYITNAHVNVWIQGYPDGTFKADDSVTRAETVTMLNSILGRKIHIDAIPVSVSAGGFTDLDKSHWAYANIMEAAHSHEYTKDEEGFEEWLDFDKGESEL